jgi:hypothetical protein
MVAAATMARTQVIYIRGHRTCPNARVASRKVAFFSNVSVREDPMLGETMV